MGKLRPESLLNNQSLQNNLDRLRIDGGYDFGGLRCMNDRLDHHNQMEICFR